jgi:hypothetical protein
LNALECRSLGGSIDQAVQFVQLSFIKPYVGILAMLG